MSKNRLIYTILISLCVLGFWLFDNFYTPDTYTEKIEGTEKLAPLAAALLPSSTTGQIVVHNHYMLSYSEAHEQAEWVAYTLKKEHLTYDDRERPYFIEDPKVKSKSADWRNYKGSGYDRGHLCPAGDRRFSEFAYNETFYTSNIAPQQRAFNAGVWNRLEQKVRQWCKQYGQLSIITGGVLQGAMQDIGQEDVSVPNAFYKIVVRKQGEQYKVLAFLMPNKESNKPLNHFLVPVDKVESLTGIDFFKALKPIEGQLEKAVNKAGWKF